MSDGGPGGGGGGEKLRTTGIGRMKQFLAKFVAGRHYSTTTEYFVTVLWSSIRDF